MAYKPTRMDQIKKIIEYRKKGFSIRRIARLLGMSKNMVKVYIRRIEERQVDISLLNKPESCQEVYRPDVKKKDPRETDLENRLPGLIQELGRVGVTRHLLWEEYIAQYPTGFSFSRFCRKIKQ